MGSIDIFDSNITAFVSLISLLLLTASVVYVNLDTKFSPMTWYLCGALYLEMLSSYLGYNISFYSTQGVSIGLLVSIELILLLASMVFLSLAASRILINDVPDFPIISFIVTIGLVAIGYFVLISPDGMMVNKMRHIFPMAGFAYLALSFWSRVRMSNNRGALIAAISTSFVTFFIFMRMINIDYFMDYGWYLPAFTYVSLTLSLLVMKTDYVEKMLGEKNHEIEKYDRRIEEIIKLSPFPIIISRLSDDKIILANNNAIKLFGMNPVELERYKLKDFFADADNRHKLNDRLEKDREVQDFEILVKTPTGTSPFWLLTSANIIDYNYDIAIYLAFQDITSRKNRESILKNQATRDPLTSLFNRRYFEDEVTKRIASAKDSGQDFSVLMVDADKFKNVNDTYGHKVGDAVLIELAQTCEKALRPDDIVARYGGEEFVIFLSGTPAENAFIVAERLRKTISTLKISADDGSQFGFTVSIGISSNKISENIDTLIKTADYALYRAKENGRNQSQIFSSDDLKKFKASDKKSKKSDNDVSQIHPIFANEDNAEISLLDGIASNQIIDSNTKIEDK